MRCPNNNDKQKSGVPKECPLIQPPPRHDHKSKETIHDPETNQAEYEKCD